MLALKCSSPQYVYNPLVKGRVQVSCGHCLSCRVSKRNNWIVRLNKEMEQSAAVLFITLTYDNDHIPLCHVDPYEKSLVYDYTAPDWIHPEYKLQDLSYIGKPVFKSYVSGQPFVQQGRVYRKKLEGKFGICLKTDVQKFIKRLRSRLVYDKEKVLSDVDSSERSFRYFIVSEYGPNTYRPHYHGLLFFRDVRVAEAVRKLYLAKSWRLCDLSRIDVQRVVSNAPSYVAKYINCDTDVPPVLRLESTRSFYLFSKNPCIGFTDEVDDLFAYEYESQERFNKVVVSKDNIPHEELFDSPGYITRYYFPRFLCCSDSYTFRRFYPTLLQAALNYSFTGYLPSCQDHVIAKYHFDPSHRKSPKPSQYLTDYSDYEFCYGFPINRTFIRRVGDLIKRFGITIGDYDLLYKKHLARSFSNRFRYYADWQSERMVEESSRLYLVYTCINGLEKIPFYAEELPEFLLYDTVDPLLRSYGLSVMDLFDDQGKRKPYTLRDPELSSLVSSLKVKEDLFFTKRKHNFLLYGC